MKNSDVAIYPTGFPLKVMKHWYNWIIINI